MDTEVSDKPARKRARASTVNIAVVPQAIDATMGVDLTPQTSAANSALPNGAAIPRTVPPPKAVDSTMTQSGTTSLASDQASCDKLPPTVLNHKSSVGEKSPTDISHNRVGLTLVSPHPPTVVNSCQSTVGGHHQNKNFLEQIG